jgi:hypothetical protein
MSKIYTFLTKPGKMVSR